MKKTTLLTVLLAGSLGMAACGAGQGDVPTFDSDDIDIAEFEEYTSTASDDWDTMRVTTFFAMDGSSETTGETSYEKREDGKSYGYGTVDVGEPALTETFTIIDGDHITHMWIRTNGGDWELFEDESLNESTDMPIVDVVLIDADERTYEVTRYQSEVGEFSSHETYDDQWRVIQTRQLMNDMAPTYEYEYDVDVDIPDDVPQP